MYECVCKYLSTDESFSLCIYVCMCVRLCIYVMLLRTSACMYVGKSACIMIGTMYFYLGPLVVYSIANICTVYTECMYVCMYVCMCVMVEVYLPYDLY